MKKVFLLIFFLGLGYGIVVGMNDNPKRYVDLSKPVGLSDRVVEGYDDEEVEEILKTSDELKLLRDLLLSWVEAQYNSKSASRINDVMAKIVLLDPAASQVRFNDATILEHLLHNHKPARFWGGPNTHLPDWIEWFMLRGVPVDGLSEEGYTALAWAVYYKRPDVVRKLIWLGAKPSTVNKPKKGKGFTALDRAQGYKDSTVADVKSIYDMVEHPETVLNAPSASATLSSDPVSATPVYKSMATHVPDPVEESRLTMARINAHLGRTTEKIDQSSAQPSVSAPVTIATSATASTPIATALPITTIPVQGRALTTEEVSQAEIQKTTIAWPCVKLGLATVVCVAVVYIGYRWYTKTQPDEHEEMENVEQESI